MRSLLLYCLFFVKPSKTLAFLLPAIVHINAQPYLQPGDGPIVLVIAPTRELAVQIKVECDKFGHSSGIKNTCVSSSATLRLKACCTTLLRQSLTRCIKHGFLI